MKKNTDIFSNSIISNELINLSEDIVEIGIDAFLANGLLKEIPIINSFIELAKVGIGIRDKLFAKKILKFLYELKEIPDGVRREYVNKLNANSNYSAKVGESLLLIIDKLDDMRKAELIGKLFAYLINGVICYETFLRLSIIIEKCFLPDLSKLKLFCNNGIIEDEEKHILYNLGVLNSLGIDGQTYLYNKNEEPTNKKIQFNINENGKAIVELLNNFI